MPSWVSGLATIVGLILTWTAIWIAGPPALAAVVTMGTLALFGGSLLAGLRRRGAAVDGPIDPERAWATYRSMRSTVILSMIATPVIIGIFIIYVDPPLARWLGASGLVILFLSSIRSNRYVLSQMRDGADQASGLAGHQA